MRSTKPADKEAAESLGSDPDTVPLKHLKDAGGANPLDPESTAGVDPYRTDENPNSVRRHRRRTLDDMRKLSEEIKRSRTAPEPEKPAAKPPEKATGS